jgi:uncharacterized protein YpmS
MEHTLLQIMLCFVIILVVGIPIIGNRWSAQNTQLQQFNTTPGEENGAYMTTTQKNNLISTFSLPFSPESH